MYFITKQVYTLRVLLYTTIKCSTAFLQDITVPLLKQERSALLSVLIL